MPATPRFAAIITRHPSQDDVAGLALARFTRHRTLRAATRSVLTGLRQADGRIRVNCAGVVDTETREVTSALGLKVDAVVAINLCAALVSVTQVQA